MNNWTPPARVKTSRKAFEAKLIAKHGQENMAKRITNVEAGLDDIDQIIYEKITLYYVNGEHAASWQKGEGWEFE